MASVSTENLKDGRKRYRVTFRDEHGKRRFLRLPGVTKKDASEVASKVQAIVSARITGAPLGNAVAEWLSVIGDELNGKLAKAGLVDLRKQSPLGVFCDEFIESRKAESRPRTVINWQAARSKLTERLGEETPLRDITAEDAVAWRKWLVASKYAPATVAAHVKRAKQFFREAIRLGYLTVSPFENLVAGDDSNASRKAYVPIEDIEKLLEVAPDADWRLMIALARFGGLRTPSETLSLRWQDIDWQRGMMRVESIKTAKQGKPFRDVPIFGELRPYLEEAFEQAPEGAVYCVGRYRGEGTNLRTHLLRLVDRAGLKRWPRIWHALRASRATDLADQFPSHTAAEWLGHTEEIAKRNYRSVTAEHLAQAQRGDSTKAPFSKQHGDPSGTGGGTAGHRNDKKPTQSGVFPGSDFPEKGEICRTKTAFVVPRRGVEPLSPP